MCGMVRCLKINGDTPKAVLHHHDLRSAKTGLRQCRSEARVHKKTLTTWNTRCPEPQLVVLWHASRSQDSVESLARVSEAATNETRFGHNTVKSLRTRIAALRQREAHARFLAEEREVSQERRRNSVHGNRATPARHDLTTLCFEDFACPSANNCIWRRQIMKVKLS